MVHISFKNKRQVGTEEAKDTRERKGPDLHDYGRGGCQSSVPLSS